MSKIIEPIVEFEKTQLILEGIFQKMAAGISSAFKPKVNYKQSLANSVSNYKNKVDSGQECKGLKVGKGHNELFWSETGSLSAIFGKNRNMVNDIGDLKISKRELRCYDLKKDLYKIGWLFSNDASYQAEKIWGIPGEIHFKGVWKAGFFYGVWESPIENWKTDRKYFKGTGLDFNKLKNTTNKANPIEYYLYNPLSRKQRGPFTSKQIINLFKSAKINRTSQIWREELGPNYIFLKDLPEFKDILSAP